MNNKKKHNPKNSDILKTKKTIQIIILNGIQFRKRVMRS